MIRFMRGLAVAPAAADRGIDVPLADKLLAQLPLGGAGRRFPVEIGDLIERAEMILRGTVAFQAPTHAVRFGVIDDLHVVDVAVTGDTTHAPVHVNRVVEVHVVGSLVNPDPGNRLAGFP